MELNFIGVTEGDTATTIHLDKLENGLIATNALSELTRVMHYIEDESPCKFLIFRGGKEWFSKGLAIDSFYPAKIDHDGFRRWEKLLRTIEDINKVTVAAIEGACFGAAIDLALTCDVRIAAAQATFSHDQVKKGVLPGQTAFQLGKFCGLGRMMELIQTGRTYTGHEAVQMGILNRAYEVSSIDEGIAEVMAEYNTMDAKILMLTRRLSKESYSMAYEDFIGSYLAALHLAISKSVVGQSEHDGAGIA